jgi:WD40 repeat protein
LKDNRLEVLPLRGDDLRAAITRPAHDVDVYVESALVERLVTDAAGEPGALPLVQETLVLLWGRLERRFLPLVAYETLVMARSRYGEPPRSGLQVALAEHADATLQRLPDDEARATAKLVLLRLVQFMDGREDVRRQLGMDKLAEGLDERRVQLVVEQLARARLLTLSAGLPSQLVRVDLSHEAMITGWPALAAWIVERRTAETTRRALEQKADEWDQKGRGLLDHVELADAERWRDSPDAAELGMSDELARLVDASAAAQSARLLREQRINRRFRMLSGVLALLLLIAIGGGIAAVVQRNQAQEQRRAALSGELALTAASLPPERLDLALLLSQEAIYLRSDARNTGSLLDALRSNPRVVRMLQPGVPVQSVAVTADGRYVAGGGEDGFVRVWELETGREVGGVRRIEGEVRRVVFSPDGSRVAAAGSEGFVRQWSTTSSEESAPPLRGHDGSVRALAYDPTGRVLATAGQDSVVILWDAASGADTGRHLDGHTDWVNALAFTPDGTTLLSGGGRTENKSTDQRILAWDVATGALKAVLDGHTDAVRALAVKGDGSQVVSAGADRAVVQWDLAAFTPIRALTGNTERLFDVAYSTDGQVIASAGRDHTIHLWDSSSGEPLGEPLRAHGAAVRGIAIVGGTLVSGGNDGRIFVWDLDDPDRSRLGSRLPDQFGPVGAVATAPQGLVIATGSNDGRVVLRGADGRPQGSYLQVPGRVNALVFSPDGDRLATLTFDGNLQVWDSQTRQSVAGPVETGDAAAVMAWSARGDRLATGGDGRVVRMWDASLRPVGGPLSGHANWVTALSFRKSDDALISAGADGVIEMWTRGSTTPQPINRPASLMTAGIFSPDGRSVITGDREGDVVVWPSDSDSASRTGQRFVSTGGPVVSSLAVSNDGRLLAVGDESGGLHLWDISTSEPQDIGPLASASGAVRSLAFTPDSSQLISGDDAGAQLWNVDPASWRQVACEVVGRNLGPSEQDDYLGGSPGHHCPGLPEGRDPAEPPAGSDDD